MPSAGAGCAIKPSLDGPKAKLARAREHIETFEVEVSNFMDTQPYRGTRDPYLQNGSHIWRLKIDRVAPPRLGILVGDIIHNLRSCLDHLAWQLSLKSTTDPFERTEFPIFITERPTTEYKHGFQTHGIKKIPDVPDEAKKLIEALQPYQPQNAAWGPDLWWLHEIDRFDKHRLVPTLAALNSGRMLPVMADTALAAHRSDSKVIEIPPFARNDGDIVLRVGDTLARDLQREPEFYFDLALDVADDRRRGLAAVSFIDRMYKAVGEKVLPQFEQFF